MDTIKCYKILELELDAPLEQVQKAYKKMMMATAP